MTKLEQNKEYFGRKWQQNGGDGLHNEKGEVDMRGKSCHNVTNLLQKHLEILSSSNGNK